MNALELLKQDHRKVAELFDQVEATEDEQQHLKLFEQIKTECCLQPGRDRAQV